MNMTAFYAKGNWKISLDSVLCNAKETIYPCVKLPENPTHVCVTSTAGVGKTLLPIWSI